MYICLQKLGGGGTGDIFPSEEALTDNLLNFAGTPKVIIHESVQLMEIPALFPGSPSPSTEATKSGQS